MIHQILVKKTRWNPWGFVNYWSNRQMRSYIGTTVLSISN